MEVTIPSFFFLCPLLGYMEVLVNTSMLVGLLCAKHKVKYTESFVELVLKILIF